MAKIIIDLHDSESLHDFVIEEINVVTETKGDIKFSTEELVVNYAHRPTSASAGQRFLMLILSNLSKETKNFTDLLIGFLKGDVDFQENVKGEPVDRDDKDGEQTKE